MLALGYRQNVQNPVSIAVIVNAQNTLKAAWTPYNHRYKVSNV